MPAARLPENLPSIAYLRACFSYTPETGELFWLRRPADHFDSIGSERAFTSRWTGKPVGARTSLGYLMTSVCGVKILVHRIVWAMQHGAWPNYFVDHINGQKDDNRIINLRDVPQSLNGLGLVKSKKNTSGHTGVTWNRKLGKWAAQVKYRGKNLYLGLYVDIEDAVEARKKANESLGFSGLHGQDNPNTTSSASPGRLKRHNVSGHLGVSLWDGRWVAAIGLSGKRKYIGSYDTKEEAIAARKAAEIRYGVADRVHYGSGAPILPA